MCGFRRKPLFWLKSDCLFPRVTLSMRHPYNGYCDENINHSGFWSTARYHVIESNYNSRKQRVLAALAWPQGPADCRHARCTCLIITHGKPFLWLPSYLSHKYRRAPQISNFLSQSTVTPKKAITNYIVTPLTVRPSQHRRHVLKTSWSVDSMEWRQRQSWKITAL